MGASILGGPALVMAAAIGFGTLGLSARRMGELGVSALPYVTIRSLVGGLAVAAAMAALAWAGREAIPRPWLVARRERVALLAASACGAGLNLALFAALERAAVAPVLVTFYAYPALVSLGAVRFYGEPIDRRRAIALTLASAGLLVVVLAPATGNGLSIDPLGLALAALAAVCQATFSLITGRGFPSVPALASSGFLILSAGVVFLFLTVVAGQLDGLGASLVEPAWPWLFMAAIVGAALPTTALVAGIRRIGPARAAILMMLEPVVGVALAALLLGERPSLIQVAGAAAVIASGAILQRPSAYRAPAVTSAGGGG